MQAYPLIAHPSCPPLQVNAVEARVGLDDPNWLRLRWRVEGAGQLVLPRIGSKKRADGLWQTTCFELFLQPEGEEGYSEWNFSPSRSWNAYEFHGYRSGMRESEVGRAPDGQIHAGYQYTLFDVAIPRSALPDEPCAMALTAVLEEEGGVKSYWSIAHPPQDKPDFHDPACFATTLDPRIVK
ncbi:DOMON-like domain-containing protein [Erythrobacteraceae bacterium E2-1 Yellow Sea]|nr:DOMON-like domain-containing protein [Erythrobacteraceae bacterium E2-1 Yellow Sea]